MAPVVFQSAPTIEEVVANIRRNTNAVNQLRSNVKVTMDGIPTSVNGTLLVERPDRLRLKVGVLGATILDIGSNSERFWIFNKSSFGGQQPAVYYANHQEYEGSELMQTFNLRPQWIIDAMGLLEFGANEQVQGPFQRDGLLELHTSVPSANGVMNRVIKVDGKTGVVLQQAIYDQQHRLLGWATSSKHRHFPEQNAVLPGHIELNIVDPAGQTVKMAVNVQSHSLNSLYVDPQVTWAMPQPKDVPAFDLTRIDSNSLQGLFSSNQPIQGGAPAPDDQRRRPFQLGRLRGFDLR